MKKLILLFFTMVGVLLIGAGCAITAPTTTTMETTDPATGVTTKTTVSESAFKSFLKSTENKLVLVNKQGWTAGMKFVPPGSDTTAAMGEVVMVIDKNDATYLSIPMEKIQNDQAVNAILGISGILASGRAGGINMTTSGISASTPGATVTTPKEDD